MLAGILANTRSSVIALIEIQSLVNNLHRAPLLQSASSCIGFHAMRVDDP